jgi:hypothetical protein
MKRFYVCKGCGERWERLSQYSSYLQPCPKCGRNTRPEKKPDIVHYAVRGLEPRHALCDENIVATMDNFGLRNVSCPDCLSILAEGNGLCDKCYYCRHFTYPINKPYWRFCIAEPLPEEVKFELTNHLNMDAADKGCTTRFEYSRKWLNFFRRAGL